MEVISGAKPEIYYYQNNIPALVICDAQKYTIIQIAKVENLSVCLQKYIKFHINSFGCFKKMIIK